MKENWKKAKTIKHRQIVRIARLFFSIELDVSVLSKSGDILEGFKNVDSVSVIFCFFIKNLKCLIFEPEIALKNGKFFHSKTQNVPAPKPHFFTSSRQLNTCYNHQECSNHK